MWEVFSPDLLESQGMKDTPDRVLRFWEEASQGLEEEARSPLQKRFPCDYDDIVVVRNIDFQSLCEHHLLPFIGQAHVAYIPNGEVVGLSKFARVIDILASRPQLQERLTNQFGEIVRGELNAKGVGVVVQAVHTCMSARGVKKPNAETVTSYMSGKFREDAAARSEVLSLLLGGK